MFPGLCDCFNSISVHYVHPFMLEGGGGGGTRHKQDAHNRKLNHINSGLRVVTIKCSSPDKFSKSLVL